MPFENSSNGAVNCTLDCLVDSSNEVPDVEACKETYVDIQHCLMGNMAENTTADVFNRLSLATVSESCASKPSIPDSWKRRSLPLTDLRHITDVYSHSQALGQCRTFLSTYLKHAEQHEATSTSKAAAIVAQQHSPTSVAIASKLAAEVRGLDIMATAIQDSEDNTTRFLVLQRRDGPLQLTHPNQSTKWKALLALSVRNNTVGGLAEALQVLKRHKLNLTNIDKRPDRLKPWHYVFIVTIECIGSFLEIDSQLEKAVKDLSSVGDSCRRLGRWK